MTVTRETREGWPLPTVETEVNGYSKSTNERGPSLVGSLGCRAGTRYFCHSNWTTTKYLFLTGHYSFVPIAQQAGQAFVLVRLYLSMCL